MNVVDVIEEKIQEEIRKGVREGIRKKCITKKCGERDCSVSLVQMTQDSVLIDMDRYVDKSQGSEPRCDYLFIQHARSAKNIEPPLIVPIELKKGRAEIGKVVQQLQAGANHADHIVPKTDRFRFVPVVFCGSIHPRVRHKFKGTVNHISFRSEKKLVQIRKCGTRLVDVPGIKP